LLNPIQAHYQAVLRPAGANTVCYFLAGGKPFPSRAKAAGDFAGNPHGRKHEVSPKRCELIFRDLIAETSARVSPNSLGLIWLSADFIERHFPADRLSGFGIALFLSALQGAPGCFKRFVEVIIIRVSRRERPQDERIRAAGEMIGLFGK